MRRDHQLDLWRAEARDRSAPGRLLLLLQGREAEREVQLPAAQRVPLGRLHEGDRPLPSGGLSQGLGQTQCSPPHRGLRGPLPIPTMTHVRTPRGVLLGQH